MKKIPTSNLKNSTSPKTPRSRPTTKVAIACQYASEGNISALKELSDSVDLSLGDYDHRTPLMLAATSGHLDVVEFLLSKGVDVEAVDRWGATALNCAIKFDQTEIINVLKKYASDKTKVTLWNSENDDVSTILYSSFRRGSSVTPTSFGCISVEDEEVEGTSFFDLARKSGAELISIHDAILVNSTKDEMREFILAQLICETDEDKPASYDELEEYKELIVDGMSYEQMAHSIIHKVVLKYGRRPDGSLYTKSYGVEPIFDLLTRRYQIVTPKGVVLMGAEAHKHSVNILKFCFKKLGLPILLSLPDPLRMCGNDYIPAGPELSFMGTGIKTNEAAVRYLLQKDVFGTKRVAMVCDIFQRSASHCLDRVIKLVSDNCFVIQQDIMGKDNINRRLVTEYVRRGRKDYVATRSDIELSEYLVSLGYHLIVIPSHLEGERIYNAGKGRLNVSKKELADIIKQNPHFKGTVEVSESRDSVNEILFENSYLPFRKSVKGSYLSLQEPNLSSIPKIWDTSKSKETHQTTSTVLMVAPVGFQTNVETAMDNFFMKKANETADQIEHNALVEFSGVHRALTDAGIQVVLFSSERFHGTPDAVFPNNWFTTHAASEVSKGATVVFYPMKTPSRRAERRQYIVSQLQSVYQEEISFAQWENEDFPHFLEGTGVLVLDRVRKIAYAALSKRCYRKIANTWADRLGYTLVLFKATDAEQRPIYHTNVMMSVGTTLAIVCMESIKEGESKDEFKTTLSKSHEILEISREQVDNLCGNVLEVSNKSGQRFWVMSERARKAFTDEQIVTIKKHCHDIISANIDTIETIGGGGIRCMMGELF